MTDKVKIKAIIKQYADKGERLLEAYGNGDPLSITSYWDGYKDCADGLLRELEDMQEELVSEELEKAAIEICSELLKEETVIIDGYEYVVPSDAEECFKAGALRQKQQLMAKAVDATVHIDAGGYPYIPQMELYDHEKDIPFAKEGDKYKVILIKEN